MAIINIATEASHTNLLFSDMNFLNLATVPALVELSIKRYMPIVILITYRYTNNDNEKV